MPFAPTDLSGLQAWYAARLEGYADAASMTTWTDRSGLGNTLSVSSGRTAAVFHTNQVNGQSAGTFNGSSTAYDFGAAVNLQTASTIFVVAKVASTAAKSTLVSGLTNSLTWWQANGGPKLHGADKTASSQLGASTTAANTNWNQMNTTYDGTTINFRTNLASDGSAAPAVAITVNETVVGFNSAGTNEFYNGQVAELLIYNRVLNSTEIGQVESYLSGFYTAVIAGWKSSTTGPSLAL